MLSEPLRHYNHPSCIPLISQNQPFPAYSLLGFRECSDGANDYFRHFLKQGERFVIRVKKNRSVIYNERTCNIMDGAGKHKGNYRMDFEDRHGKKVACKMSCIPVRLCVFPEKELVLAAVYGFGAEPMLLLSNLRMQEKKQLCHIVAKVYLMRWRGYVLKMGNSNKNRIAYSANRYYTMYKTDFHRRQEFSDSCFHHTITKGENNMGKLCDNKRYCVYQCAMMFDGLYASAKILKNDYSNRISLSGDNLKEWQNNYYPNLVETGILKNGSFFDAEYADRYGVSKDGTFSKAGYCNILYECFKILANGTKNLACLQEVNYCCAMLEPFVDTFAGNRENCAPKDLPGSGKEQWKSKYYASLVQSGKIEDGDFFGNTRDNPNYGIGADAACGIAELQHFLYRAYRYAYSYTVFYDYKMVTGLVSLEHMENVFYETLDDGIISSVFVVDCGYMSVRVMHNGQWLEESVDLNCYENYFAGIGETTGNRYELSVENGVPASICTLYEDSDCDQRLHEVGTMLAKWTGRYEEGQDVLIVKSDESLLWNGKELSYTYDERASRACVKGIRADDKPVWCSFAYGYTGMPQLEWSMQKAEAR